MAAQRQRGDAHGTGEKRCEMARRRFRGEAPVGKRGGEEGAARQQEQVDAAHGGRCDSKHVLAQLRPLQWLFGISEAAESLHWPVTSIISFYWPNEWLSVRAQKVVTSRLKTALCTKKYLIITGFERLAKRNERIGRF